MDKRASFCLILLLASFVSASIQINGVDVKSTYSPNEKLQGKINLTLKEFMVDTNLVSSEGDSISLKEFLDANGAKYKCDPEDCSSSYKTISTGTEEKILQIKDDEKKYIGFFLKGPELGFSGFSFNLSSDFQNGILLPLKILFFEDEQWEFSAFSNSFSAKYYGCYDDSKSFAKALIQSVSYCETISLTKTNLVKLGAKVEKLDSKELTMTIYSEDENHEFGSCKYDPIKAEDCEIKFQKDQLLEEGKYSLCVSSSQPSKYKIFEENSGQTCGFIYGRKDTTSNRDYAIFASTAVYNDSSSLSSKDIPFKSVASGAENIIERKYGGDCSGGCIFPLEIEGVSQNLKLYNLSLYYFDNNGDFEEKNIYDLKVVPATVDFEGTLDFKFTKFNVSRSGDYSVSLGEKELFKKSLTKILAPQILSITPLTAPAKFSTEFSASVNFVGSGNEIVYSWIFGDGSKEDTKINKVIHSYNTTKKYNITLTVSTKTLSSKNIFEIEVVNPKDAILKMINEKNTSLNKFSASIKNLPTWYGQEIRKITKVDEYISRINKINTSSEILNNESLYPKIIEELYSIKEPTELVVFREKIILTDDTSKIDPNAVLTKETSKNLASYRNLILDWQENNIDSTIFVERYSFKDSGQKENYILSVYDADVRSFYSEESYLVINSKDLFFENKKAVIKKDSSVLTLGSSKREIIKFYSTSPDEISLFASPNLDNAVLSVNIDTSCNYNLVCEKNLGESFGSCRSDCKPTTKIVIVSIVIFLFVLVLYTLIQLWYVLRYENYLFEDRSKLYNLMMFIANAKARGQGEEEIYKQLKKVGWSGERISYAINKSNGKRTGLPEIIPVTLIGNYIRNRSAKKNIATLPQQQNGRNINKLGMPGSFNDKNNSKFRP